MTVISKAHLVPSTLVSTFMLIALTAACGDNFRLRTDGGLAGDDSGSGGGDDASTGDDAAILIDALPTIPMVIANVPADGTVDFASNGTISATFSETMNPTTLTAATVTLTVGVGAVPVTGTVLYSNTSKKVIFRPTARLAPASTFKATIKTGAKSSQNVALASDFSWSFTTGIGASAEPAVDLGSAANFVILAKTGISTVPTSAIIGDLGVSPGATASITGFALINDASNVFARSTQVTGKVFAANMANPTPANLTAAVDDMEIAFTDAASRAPDVTELGAGNIGGLTLAPGVYKWGTGLLIPTNVTLSGSANDVWIFQIAQTLTMNTNTKILLAGGAQAKNIFWQASGQVTLNAGAHLEGVLIGQTAIVLKTGASVTGAMLAQSAATIDKSTIKKF